MTTAHHGTFLFGHEKREHEREPVLRKGYIIDESATRVGCVIIDQSRRGASLRFDELARVPSYFTLFEPAENLSVTCAVARRNGSEVGVRFVSMPKRLPVKPAAARKAGAPLFGGGR